MSDVDGQPAAEVTAPVAPSQPAADSGSSELEALRSQLDRANQRVSGMDAFVQAARTHGFDDPSKFETANQRLAALGDFESKSGVSLDQWLAARQPDESVGAGEEIDLEAFEERVLTKAEERAAAKIAQREYEAAIGKHDSVLSSALTDDQADELLKGQDPRFLRKILRDAYALNAHNNRAQLDDGPLKGRYAAIDDSVAKKTLEDLREFQKSLIGEAMAEKADAASKPVRPSGTPAGAGAGQGSPKSEQTRPPTKRARAKQLADAAVKARFGG